MMRRWFLLLAILLAPATALAGGGGNIKLARPVFKVAVGETTIYFQALQHGVHPRGDMTATVIGVGPDGKEVKAEAALDPAYGDAQVFAAKVAFNKPGEWGVRIEPHHNSLFFPVYKSSLTVVPAGTAVPDPGPVTPYRESASSGHSHDQSAAPRVIQPAGDGTAAQPSADQHAHDASQANESQPAVPSRLLLILGGSALLAITGAILLWRRRGATA